MAKLQAIPLTDFMPMVGLPNTGAVDISKTSYRPTLVMGAGGTAVATIRRLKTLLRRYYGDDLSQVIQFLVFDTTQQEVGAGEEPLDAGEFVYLGPFDAADMVRFLDDNPRIASWWPGGRERPFRPDFAGTGANRVRAVGRLVLFHYISSVIVPRIEAKLDRSIQVNAQKGIGATSIKGYLIGSLAGGTFSGMFLDLAYLFRMVALRRMATAYVTGVLVTDDPFLPKVSTQNTRAEFSANTYAALLELNHFTRTRTFREEYSEMLSTHELPEKAHRPFDVTYLLGLHNTEGQALESFENLADMIAATVTLEIASPMQDTVTNILDNVKANGRTIAGQPTAYSSFALGSLVYPVRGIASWCALNGLKAFAEEVFLTARRTPSEIEGEVIAFTQKAQVEAEQADQLLDRLMRTKTGDVAVAPALSHDSVMNLPEASLSGYLQRAEETLLGDLAQLRQSMTAEVPKVKKAFAVALTGEADSTLRDPEKGPLFLNAWLAALVSHFVAQREGMVEAQGRAREESTMAQAALTTAKSELQKALLMGGWNPWRNGTLRKARARVVSAFNHSLEALIELEQYTLAVQCLTTFGEQARALERQAGDLVGSWREILDLAAQLAEGTPSQLRAMATDYSLMRTIVTAEELKGIFEKHAPDLSDTESRAYHASRYWAHVSVALPDWRLGEGAPGGQESDLPTESYGYLAEWFMEQLQGKTLLERLEEKYGREWMREVDTRYQKTAPFWSVKIARFATELQSNLQHEPQLVGYGEADINTWRQSVSQAVGSPLNAVNNKNPHELVILKTSHGLPAFALRTIGTMNEAYKRLMRQWLRKSDNDNPMPLHASREWEAMVEGLEPRAPQVEGDEVPLPEVVAATNGSTHGEAVGPKGA